jgi:Ser/Thr protein kinase RdoA (MazF antagonist)
MKEPAFNFSHLDPNALIDALSTIGIYPDSGLLALNSYENRVYQFKDEQQKRYVVKFYRSERWTNEQIKEEHEFSFELADENIAIAAPIRLDGESLFEHLGYRFALFPSIGGRTFEVDNWEQLESVGHALGKIHQVGKRRTFSHRPSINLDEYLTQSRAILTNVPFIPTGLENKFFKELDALIRQITQKWHTDWQGLRLHGDCHPSNILWRDEPVFVDLDDARNGPAIQDLWLLLNGDRQDQIAQLDTLVEAYECFYDFPHQELQLIEPLRGLRMIYYMAWLAKRWKDPAFPHAFPWLSEASYWENQIVCFKEQQIALEMPPLSFAPQW